MGLKRVRLDWIFVSNFGSRPLIGRRDPDSPKTANTTRRTHSRPAGHESTQPYAHHVPMIPTFYAGAGSCSRETFWAPEGRRKTAAVRLPSHF